MTNKGKLNGLSLFSGYAGIDLALADYVRPLIYCEIERYAQGILLSRMDEGSIPFAPIWGDVRELDGNQFRGLVDIVYGGFPCQDISVAGKGAGLDGKRSGLFFEIIRICKEASPLFIFLENVPAIRTRGAIEVAEALAAIGYDCRWHHLSAAEVGANHKRERWFLLAHARGERRQQITRSAYGDERAHGTKNNNEPQCDGESDPAGQIQRTMADTSSERLEGLRISQRISAQESRLDSIADAVNDSRTDSDMQRCGRQTIAPTTKDHEGKWQGNGWPMSSPLERSWWEIEPDICRVVDGTPFRMDRVKALGNGVVPLQTKKAFEILMGVK